MAGDVRGYRRVLGATWELLTHARRHAQILQLAADGHQLEIEVLLGRVSGEELTQRFEELRARYTALRGKHQKRSAGDGEQRSGDER